MTSTFTPLTLINQLQLPATERVALSFCKNTRASSLLEWVKSLPMTQISRTGALLYQGMREIVELKTEPANRLEILEHIRPYLQQNIQSLSRSFLDQPLILPENAMKTAIVAQALQRNMTLSYCLVVKELLLSRPKGNFKESEKKSIGLALHRAITGLGLQFVRSAQIYTQAPARMWQELHSLLLIAESLELLKSVYGDPLQEQEQVTRPANTIEQAYLCIAMLACARPNQLSQSDVGAVYQLFNSWSKLVTLEQPNNSSSNLYVIDLTGNQPPHYKSEADAAAAVFELGLTTLVNTIKKQIESDGESKGVIEIPATLAEHVLHHLINAWGNRAERLHPRRQSRGTLEVAVGLTSIHFNLTGQMTFRDFVHAELMRGQFSVKDLEDSSDPWDNAFDSEGLGRSASELGLSLNMNDEKASSPAITVNTPHPLHRVQILDSSSDGYRLDWRDEMPPQVKTGEIISLHQGNQHRSIGVIRWAKQHKHGSQLGIQIIAHQVKAAAAQQLLKVGEDNVFMHALLTSSSRGTEGQDRIITAAHPFRVRNKVKIKDDKSTYTALLTSVELSTSCINLFSFRHQETVASVISKGGQEGDGGFNSDW